MLIKFVIGGEVYQFPNDYDFYSYRSNSPLIQNSFKKPRSSYKTYVDINYT